MTTNQSLKEKQRKEREELIVQVTQEVLLEQGYHDMSMDVIAARVGIAKGTLYLHFAKKEDLVAELFRRRLSYLQQTVVQAIEYDGTAQQRLMYIFKQTSQGLTDHIAQLMYTLHNSVELLKVVKDKLHDTMQEIINGVTSILEEGKKNGEFDATMPTGVMVSIFFTLLSPRSLHYLQTETISNELFMRLARTYFKCISTTPPLWNDTEAQVKD